MTENEVLQKAYAMLLRPGAAGDARAASSCAGASCSVTGSRSLSTMHIVADLTLGDTDVAYDHLARHRARKAG